MKADNSITLLGIPGLGNPNVAAEREMEAFVAKIFAPKTFLERLQRKIRLKRLQKWFQKNTKDWRPEERAEPIKCTWTKDAEELLTNLYSQDIENELLTTKR